MNGPIELTQWNMNELRDQERVKKIKNEWKKQILQPTRNTNRNDRKEYTVLP